MDARVDPVRLRYYRTTLRRWFARHGRDLPWRRTTDPFHILVSEILLQQTQVPRVAEVYPAFLDRFPTLHAVAEAPLAEVKAITDPLGYKVRGTWIKRIADQAVTVHAGRLPDDLAGLLALPGIGRYTAGAVLTFAYGTPAPILDTNVARVLSRWFAGTLPDHDTAAMRNQRLWALASALLPRRGASRRSAWSINQGLMDFGAQICTARAPRCDVCPVQRRCHAVRPDGGAAESHLVAWIAPAGPKPSAGGARGVRYPAGNRRSSGPAAKRSPRSGRPSRA